jgi:uncharacterized protein with von Willebrand factor type A (vWA) domain
MFATFFHELKQAGVPVTLREYLALRLRRASPVGGSRSSYLSRSVLVKDERNLDRLDRVFGHVIQRRSPRAPLPINCAACMA